MTTFEDIIAADTILQRVVAQTSAPKPSRRGNDLYFTLCDSIVSQQISTKAAAVIFGRFCALFPEGYPAADLVLQKTDEELRAASLSFQKINYLRNVARFHLESGIDNDRLDAMTDDEIIAYLTPIKGVGRWTVEMLLMFSLDRPDVFPIDDLVVRNQMKKAYGITSEGKEMRQQLTAIAETWRPFRSAVCKYLWRWKDESLLQTEASPEK